MIGILTEKPSALRNFATALGGTKGTYQGQEYLLVSARGHLYEFKDPKDQVPRNLSKTYQSWDLKYLPWDESIFVWDKAVKATKRNGRASTADNKSLLKDLKTQLSSCEEIVLASDDDPSGEGSVLAWEIVLELGLDRKRLSRMYFEDESSKSLQKAFLNRKPLTRPMEDPDYRKGIYRAKWDFLSMQWTRMASQLSGKLLRQGRLKSAMVVLVGDQLERVQHYKKIPSYQNRFQDEMGVYYTNPDEPFFKTRGEVPQSYHVSEVVESGRTKRRSSPPRLLDLSALASKLSPKGYKADQVLSCYQKMYERQIVSYPRTEDKAITLEQFKELLPLADDIARVVGVDTKLLTHREPRKTHISEGLAHGANRPGTNVPRSLSDLDAYGKGLGPLIYEILAKNFLAMLAEDYEYETVEGYVKDYPDFKGKVNVPLSQGFKQVFVDEDEDSEDSETGTGLGKRAEPLVFESFPPKPQTPTMTWLMKQLEKHNVGTGATRTSTYADVTNSRQKGPLLKDQKGKISMTDEGVMSYGLLQGTHIGSLDRTLMLLDEMKDVGLGKLGVQDGLARVKGLVQHDLDVMTRNAKEKGYQMSDANYDYVEGVFQGEDIRFKKKQRGVDLTDKEIEDLLAGKEIRKTFTSQKGNVYAMMGGLKQLSYNGFDYWGVDFEYDVPPEWCGYTFTDDEIVALREGKGITRDDWVSKKGNTFPCTVFYEEEEKGKGKRIVPVFD